LQEEVDDAKALKKGIQADWDAQKEKDDFDRDQRRIREEMKAEGARELLEQQAAERHREERNARMERHAQIKDRGATEEGRPPDGGGGFTFPRGRQKRG